VSDLFRELARFFTQRNGYAVRNISHDQYHVKFLHDQAKDDAGPKALDAPGLWVPPAAVGGETGRGPLIGFLRDDGADRNLARRLQAGRQTRTTRIERQSCPEDRERAISADRASRLVIPLGL
jgi:hypothetical protein